MKIIKFNILIALLLGMMASCGYDLEEYNINPEASTNADPNYQLNYVQMVMMEDHHVNWHWNLGMMSGRAQQLAGPWEMGQARAVWAGHEYAYPDWWQNSWSNTYKNVIDLVERSKDDENFVNVNSAARILKVFNFARLTDAYGDIPYSEAGKAYYTGQLNPKYDQQKDIYDDFFNELDAAVKAFDANKPGIKVDNIYNGDIDKWKKFANSLRLRLAMRLVKVDAAKAEQEVKAAIAASGGLMASNDDVAMLKHMNFTAEDIRNNPSSEILSAAGYNDFGICATFSEMLLNTKDPRTDVLMAAYASNDNSNPNHVDVVGYNGLVPASYAWDAPYLEGADGEWRGFYEGGYLVPHKQIVDKDDPSFLLGYAEVQLYLAEAALRGWDGGSAADYYRNGVTAAMEQLSYYGLDSDISSEQIDDYLTENPFSDSEGLRLINEQLWIHYFLNGHEAHNNWKRSGYPVLETPPAISWEPQMVDDIARRCPYIDEEYDRNFENVMEAVTRLEAQGATAAARHMDGRVWWDAE